ncbi:MAG: hypothetical protein HeimC3_06060 [Candidatus Heimdallarchaeota archaeon LC_3]|nr:MAG: hypothetical protein HeimC3_06060 [Candidatus Heimdallarchaeota archaeon LC_3]
MAPKILSEKAIPIETVKELLRKRSEVADLNYIQRITLDFGHRFSEIFPQNEEIIEKMGQDYNLTREESIQLINVNPASLDEISLVLEDKITSEEKKNLLDLITEHKEQYKPLEGQDLPTNISTASFEENDGKEEYPDKEPTDTES